jgi:hypothetical protein
LVTVPVSRFLVPLEFPALMDTSVSSSRPSINTAIHHTILVDYFGRPKQSCQTNSTRTCRSWSWVCVRYKATF